MNTRVKSIVLFIVCMVFSFNTKLFAWEDISKVVIDYVFITIEQPKLIRNIRV